MVLTASPSIRRKSGSLQFASTLYFQPVIAFLLEGVPQRWQAEIRLGLQEALVNAARHGNGLDPNKKSLYSIAIKATILVGQLPIKGTGSSTALIRIAQSPTNSQNRVGGYLFCIKFLIG